MADDEDSVAALKLQWDAAWRAWTADSADEDAWERLDRLERRILAGPARSPQDLLAKLAILRENLAAGARSDGMDVDGLDSVIAWIGASPSA